MIMILKPQDLVVLLKLVVLGEKSWSFNKMAIELGMSASEVHSAVKRAIQARLASKNNEVIKPNIDNLEKFMLNGMKFVFVPDRGEINRGIPTSYAALPLSAHFVKDNEPPPVWPDPDGEVRGESFSPLYKSVPVAARNDDKLYELLVLADGIRGGRAREQMIAEQELKRKFAEYDQISKS